MKTDSAQAFISILPIGGKRILAQQALEALLRGHTVSGASAIGETVAGLVCIDNGHELTPWAISDGGVRMNADCIRCGVELRYRG
jgi:hypothetical protein